MSRKGVWKHQDAASAFSLAYFLTSNRDGSKCQRFDRRLLEIRRGGRGGHSRRLRKRQCRKPQRRLRPFRRYALNRSRELFLARARWDWRRLDPGLRVLAPQGVAHTGGLDPAWRGYGHHPAEEGG